MDRRGVAILLALVALVHVDVASGLAAGYRCKRRVDSYGSPMPHIGKCQKKTEPCNRDTFTEEFKEVGLTESDKPDPFYLPGACNNYPADVLCCMAPPPERGAIWPENEPKDLPNGVTGDNLKCCMKHAGFGFSDSMVSKYLRPLNEALKLGGITSKTEITQFLAQVGAESGSLAWWTELDKKGCTKYDGGCDFLGRGPIQLTHKYNYVKAYNWLKKNGFISASDSENFVKNPDLVSRGKYGFLTTMWFWKIEKNLKRYADGTWKNYFWMSKRINGGTNGINHRVRRWAHCVECLGGKSPNAHKYDNVDRNPKCTAIKGECRHKDDCGDGVQKTGLCHGRTTKCCIPKEKRGACDVIGGTCGTTSCSGGKIVPGLCPGVEPKCCIPGDVAKDEGADSGQDDSPTPSECERTGGTCVSRGSSCSGYAVKDVGSKGCSSNSRCCRPACAEKLGFCRGPSDCSGGSQHRGFCPGTSICCVQGATRQAREIVVEAQSLQTIPAPKFSRDEVAIVDANGNSESRNSNDGDNEQPVFESGVELLTSYGGEDFNLHNSRFSNSNIGYNRNLGGGLISGDGMGFNRLFKEAESTTATSSASSGTVRAPYRSQFGNEVIDTNVIASSKYGKRVMTKASNANIQPSFAAKWLALVSRMVAMAKMSSRDGHVDTRSIEFIVETAGPSTLAKVYNFWTNEFAEPNENIASAEVVASAIDANELNMKRMNTACRITGLDFEVKAAEIQPRSRNYVKKSALLGVGGKIESRTEAREEALERVHQDLHRLEEEVQSLEEKN